MKKCKTCQQDFPADLAYFYKTKYKKDGTLSFNAHCITCTRQHSYDNRKIRQANAREIKQQVRVQLDADRATAKQMKFEINRAHRQAISEDKKRTVAIEKLTARNMKRLHVEALRMNHSVMKRLHSEALKMNEAFNRLRIREAKKKATRDRELAKRQTPEYKEKARIRRLERISKETPEQREKRLQEQRIYHKENREYYRAKSTEWNKKNPEAAVRSVLRRRAKKYGNGYEIYTTQQVIEIYGTDCHICLRGIDIEASRKVGSLGWEKSLQVDHVVPISKGGPDTLENVRPAHALCNMTKRDKTTEEALELLYLNKTTP